MPYKINYLRQQFLFSAFAFLQCFSMPDYAEWKGEERSAAFHGKRLRIIQIKLIFLSFDSDGRAGQESQRTATCKSLKAPSEENIFPAARCYSNFNRSSDVQLNTLCAFTWRQISFIALLANRKPHWLSWCDLIRNPFVLGGNTSEVQEFYQPTWCLMMWQFPMALSVDNNVSNQPERFPASSSASAAPFPYFLRLRPAPVRLAALARMKLMTSAVVLIAGVMLVIAVVWDKMRFRFRSHRSCSCCCRPSRDCKCTVGRRCWLKCYILVANYVSLSFCSFLCFFYYVVGFLSFLLLISTTQCSKLIAEHSTSLWKVFAFGEFSSSFLSPSSLSSAWH